MKKKLFIIDVTDADVRLGSQLGHFPQINQKGYKGADTRAIDVAVRRQLEPRNPNVVHYYLVTNSSLKKINLWGMRPGKYGIYMEIDE